MIYESGYAETTTGGPRRHLETSELEQVGQFPWNSVVGTSIESKLPIQSVVEQTLPHSRLMVELLPKATSFVRQGGKPSNTGGGG